MQGRLEGSARSLNASKNAQAYAQDLSFICKKVSYLVPNDKLNRYVKYFLNKPVEAEYFVNKFGETEIQVSFLKPFENIIC